MGPVHLQFQDWFLEQTNLPQMRVDKMLYYINTSTLQQCFSKVTTLTNHKEIFLKCTDYDSVGARWDQRFSFIKKLPGDPSAAGSQTTI